LPHAARPGKPLTAPAPRRDEHPVRIQLLGEERDPGGARGDLEGRRLEIAITCVSLRVRVQTEYTNRPPGFTEGAARSSSMACTAVSSRTSLIDVVQRA
jgi:hypothetical protein